MMKRSAENCPFYPACYVVGDCGFDDWKTSNCGLPREEQLRRADKFHAERRLKNARWRLGEDLKRKAIRGEFDERLGEYLE